MCEILMAHDNKKNIEKDINDVFDDIVLCEGKIFDESFADGYDKGKKDGELDGYHIGYHRGAEIGAEIGFYEGIVDTILHNESCLGEKCNEKVLASLQKLKRSLSSFPRVNDTNVDFQLEINNNLSMIPKKISGIHSKLNLLIDYFEANKPLINAFMGEIFSDDLWTKVIPQQIRDELHNHELMTEFAEGFQKLVNGSYTYEFYNKFKNSSDFILASNDISIRKDKSCLTDLEELKKLFNFHLLEDMKLNMHGYMSQKKLHEVKVITNYVGCLKDISNVSHVVDIGGGKGYLSSTLVLQFNIKVLGLDSSYVNTCGASKLSENIAAVWKNFQLTDINNKALGHSEINMVNENDNELNLREFYKKIVKENYKQITEYVTCDTDVVQLVETQFLEPCNGVCLIGLHTCGQLSPTSLRLFIKNEMIKSIINIGCCYHFLQEEFYDKFWEGIEIRTGDFDFPMSNFLKEKRFFLGRKAMMLCQHSVDKYSRTYPNSSSQDAERSLFHRAVLDVILKKHNYNHSVNVARLSKKYPKFHDYIYKASSKLDLDIQMSEEELTIMHEHYAKQLPMLRAFFLFRINLAPVIESIILLDRLLYLLENGVEKSFLVPFFDRSISPRGFGIMAWKEMQ